MYLGRLKERHPNNNKLVVSIQPISEKYELVKMFIISPGLKIPKIPKIIQNTQEISNQKKKREVFFPSSVPNKPMVRTLKNHETKTDLFADSFPKEGRWVVPVFFVGAVAHCPGKTSH